MRTRTLLAAFVVLVFAAPATAQAPDERTAAQALADAVKRVNAADEQIGEDRDPDDGLDAPRCRRELLAFRRGARTISAPSRSGDELRKSGDALESALARLRTDLANAQTRDPLLISGRAAWRRAAKAYTALPPRGDVCADLAAWRRAGYPLSTVRAARAECRTVFAASGRGFERKIAAAADRMRELGISEKDAKVFEGDG